MPESVLTVRTELLRAQFEDCPSGLITKGADELYSLILRSSEFRDRDTAEHDATYKQVIPYGLLSHGSPTRYYLLKRTNRQNEVRLHDRFSLGVGGHVNPSEEAPVDDIIRSGLLRELYEELYVSSISDPRYIGLINDDLTDVGRVHIGMLYEVKSLDGNVSVREHEKMVGRWATIDEIDNLYGSLESWSQIVFSRLIRTP